MAKKIRIQAELDDSKLRKQLDDIGKRKEKITVDVDSGNIENTDQSMKRLNNTVSNSNSIFSKLKNTINNTFSSGKLAMTGYLLALNEINKAARNAKTAINDMDESVTNLSIAMGKGRNEAYSYLGELNKQAKELGATTKETADSADSWIRQGKSIAETEKLVRDAMVLSKLGKIESADASEYLTASLNGYKKSASEAIDIVDKLTAVDMESASDAGGLAVSLSKTASAANMAGVSFDRLVGMVATVKEVTQDSDESVGNMFKSIFARMNQIKARKFIDAETGEALNDVEKVLNKVGIAMRDANGEFISSEKIMDDVGSKWESFDSTTQRAVATAMAGTYQYNKLIALFENYSKALQYTEVAASSAGTAMQKFNDSYLGSLEAKQNTLQASFESIVMNTDFSEVYGGILDATTALVDFINQTNALKGALAGLTVAGGIKAFLTIKTGVTEAYIALNKFQNALDITKKVSISTSEYEKLLLLSNGLSASQMKLVLSTNSLTVAQKQELLMASGLSAEEAALQLETWGMTAANTGLTAATTTLGNAFKGLWSTLVANPLIVVTAAVSAAVMAYQTYNQKLEETRQKNIDNATSASECVDELRKQYDEYMRLASIQDRTTSQEEAFKTAVDNIIASLGSKADALKDLTASTDEYSDALARATQEELQSQAVIATIGRKSAEEEFQGSFWDDWKGSKVSVDSNGKGKSLSDEAQKAVDIVSESLKEYETINRTWKNISWDISSDDPTEALEYYDSLVEAREKLVLASGDDEALLDTEIYVDLNDAINAMTESLDTYIERLYEEQKLNYMAQNGIPRTTDEYKAMESALLSVVGSSVDLQDKFKELLTADFSDLTTDIENVGNAVGDASAQAQSAVSLFNQLASSEEELDKFQSSLKSATEAYTTLLSGNYSSSELLNSIQTISQAVSDMGGSLNWEFINGQKDSLELLGDAIQHISQKYAESILSGAGIDINSEFGQMLANMITQAFEAEAAFEGMNSQLDNLQSSYQTLTEVLGSYNKTGYISLDSLQSLLTADENLIAMLEVENGQLAINQEAYENLVVAQLMEFKAKLNDAAAAEIEALAKNKAEQATNQNADASNNAVEKLDAETAAFNRNTSAAIANAVSKAEEAGVSEGEIQDILDKYNEVWNAAVSNFSGDFDGFMGGASEAGKKAGDAYVDAFEKELKKLQTLRDQGKITEKQYLDYLRKLYQKFFKDKKKYAEQYAKYEHEYLQGMKSLYESALSGITSMLDKQISAYGDARDAAVESLEQQRDAAIEALEAEKERYEQEIELIDKQIAAKEKAIQKVQDEIEAMRSANEQKKQAINLQQDEYNLQRMLNQRSKQVYKDGQIVFDTDTSGLREARQKVEDDKLEIEISKKEKEIKLIEKEIDLLNEKKDGINETIDLLDKQIDQINEYYDKLISDTEKYWDNLIKGMEDYKSRWEELGEIEENAKLISTLKQLGIEVDDVLGMSEEAFSKFKDEYVGILADIYSGNDSMLSALSDTTGRSVNQMGSYLDATQGYIDSLSGIGDSLNPLADSIGNVEESIGTLSSTASEADENLSNAADSVGNVNSSLSETASTTSTVATNVGTVVDELNQLPESEKVSGLAGEFKTLATNIGEVAKALGIGEGEAVGTLCKAMSDLNTVTLGSESEGIIGQFTLLKQAILDVIETIGSSEAQTIGSLMAAITQLNSITLDESIIKQFTSLKTAIDSVTAAISGGGGESSEGEGSGSKSAGGKSGSQGSKGNGESGGGNSLTGAIESMGDTAKKVIGESDAEGDGTVIGEFGSMETAVNDVRDAIGTGDSEGGKKSGKGSEGEGDGTLIGSIKDLGEKTAEEMGESGGDGIIGRFEQFENVIGEAEDHVQGINKGLDSINGKDVECTIKINIIRNESGGGGGDSADGESQLLGSMNLDSATYNAKYKGNSHVSGTANVTGNWGVRNPGKTLVGEMGQELWVHAKDSTFETVGDNGAEFITTESGDLIFNHLQTKELLSKGNIVGRGRALASGTALANGTTHSAGDGVTVLADGTVLRPLQPGDPMYDMMQKFDAYFNSMDGNLEKLVPNSFYDHQKQMENMVKQITNNSIVNNTRNVQQPIIQGGINITCPGVTSKEVAQQVGVELNNMFNGLHLEAMQQSMIRK